MTKDIIKRERREKSDTNHHCRKCRVRRRRRLGCWPSRLQRSGPISCKSNADALVGPALHQRWRCDVL